MQLGDQNEVERIRQQFEDAYDEEIELELEDRIEDTPRRQQLEALQSSTCESNADIISMNCSVCRQS